MIKNKIKFSLLLFVFAISGCTSLPQETPLLSEEIGEQILDAKSSHLALLNQYFIVKRNQIDVFIDQVWIPEFAKNIFKKPKINKGWNSIVNDNDKQQRLIFITRLGALIQKKINAKRIELMKPVDELEYLLTKKINNHYDSLLAANSTLTVYLKSAAAVKELQNRALKKLKLDKNLAVHIDKADEVVEKIIAGKGSYIKNKDKIDKILNKLK